MKSDIVIRNGTIIDGSGKPGFEADIAIHSGRIVAIGQAVGDGVEEIEAQGKLVTPGFVDIHTHYDGHATWASRLAPSSSHGVTTVVMGNCGVGFAPCRPEDRPGLIRLMEGVEDITASVLETGLPWTWQSFREYIEMLATRHFDMDVAVQIPHAPLRLFVMGERGANGDPATDDDIRKMAALAREAIENGAIGFSTSRTQAHRSSDGRLIGTLTARAEELWGIAAAIGDSGRGVLEAISDFDDVDAEFAILEGMAHVSGRPLSISLMQRDAAPTRWRRILSKIEDTNRAGTTIRGQVCGRPIGLLLGFELSRNPFSLCPTYVQHIESLAFAERITRLKDSTLRSRLIRELDDPATPRFVKLDRVFPFGEPLDYEPTPGQSVAALALRTGVSPAALAYDQLLEEDGCSILYAPMSNFHDGNLGAALEMMESEHTVLGLGDGGAHCGMICDASLPTWMLTHWGRDRKGRRLSLPWIVRALTAETAEAVGLADRGRIARGYRADINIIDFDRLRLRKPRFLHDLPGAGGRLDQQADGYVATIVAGHITARRGQPTGDLPGRVVMGQQAAPSV